MDTFGLEPKTFPLKVGHSNRTSSASSDTFGSRTGPPPLFFIRYTIATLKKVFFNDTLANAFWTRTKKNKKKGKTTINIKFFYKLVLLN